MKLITKKVSDSQRNIVDTEAEKVVASCNRYHSLTGSTVFYSNDLSVTEYTTWGSCIRDAYRLARKRDNSKKQYNLPSANNDPTVKATRWAEIPEEYKELHRVLKAAFAQASRGKGAERHGNSGSIPFTAQPMQSISHLIDSSKGMEFQIIKKLVESSKMGTLERRTHERLGVIVYTAGLILWDEAKTALKESLK